MIATDKHSSLLDTIVNYGRRKFYNIGLGDKPVNLLNLRTLFGKLDRFVIVIFFRWLRNGLVYKQL